MMRELRHKISIQWHITTNCNNRCRHCYVYDEKTYAEEKANTLSYDGLIKVLGSILDFENKWNCEIPVFAVTGGEPLLRRDWFEFVSVLRSYNKTVYIMCNPETLTPRNIKLMREAGITRCQMSLDGLEHMHDYFRSQGSFRRTVTKISELEDNGIRCDIMFTLYPENESELFPLIRYLDSETPLSAFCFDIGTGSGNAKELSKDYKSLQIEYLLAEYHRLKKEFKDKRRKLQLAKKVRLFELSDYLRDSIKINYCGVPVAGGCSAGWYAANILSDGSFLACRRFPLKAGKMPEQSFEEIFLGSELLKKMRRRKYYKGCGNCMLYQVCRGCPAYVYGMTGDPLAKNPMCFSGLKEMTQDPSFAEPGIETSIEEEYKFLCSSMQFDLNSFFINIMNENRFREIFLQLLDNRKEMEDFLCSPDSFFENNYPGISDYDKNTLHHYFRKKFIEGFPESNEFSKVIDSIKMRHLRD